MSEKRYETEGMSVSFDARRCIHAAECVRGLPSVFDPQRRPWVDADAAENDAIAEVVERCPTGALHYERSDGPDEAVPAENSVRVRPRGPLHVRGDLELTLPGGETIRETRMALCRCGASASKPFCDNAHREIGFDDTGRLEGDRLTQGDSDSGSLVIRLVADGPVLLEGKVEIIGTASEPQSGVKAALCRCGASRAKPHCDGSHASIGFEAGAAEREE